MTGPRFRKAWSPCHPQLTVQNNLRQEGAPRLPGPWADRPAWTALPGSEGQAAAAARLLSLRCSVTRTAPQPSPAPHPATPPAPHRLVQWVCFLPSWGAKFHLVNWRAQIQGLGGQSLRTDPETHTKSTRTAPQSTQPPAKADSHWISEGVLSAGPCCPRE